MNNTRYKLTEEEFIENWNNAESMKEFLEMSNMSNSGGTLKGVKKRASRLGLSDNKFKKHRTSYSKEELENAWRSSQNIRQVLLNLGLVGNGANYKTIRQKAKELGLTDKDFINGKREVETTIENVTKVNLIDILTNTVPYSNSQSLINRLIEAKLLERRCSLCGITHYYGQPINIELDHINGDHQDNSLHNIRLLCPNCHNPTDTYGNKKRH